MLAQAFSTFSAASADQKIVKWQELTEYKDSVFFVL